METTTIVAGSTLAGFLLGLFVSGGIVFYLKNIKKRLIFLKKDEVAKVETVTGSEEAPVVPNP